MQTSKLIALICLVVLFAFAADARHHHHHHPMEAGQLEIDISAQGVNSDEASSPVVVVVESSDAKSRQRRVPGPQDTRRCGRRMSTYVFQTCGGACNAIAPLDIATICCASQCNDILVKGACCPDKL